MRAFLIVAAAMTAAGCAKAADAPLRIGVVGDASRCTVEAESRRFPVAELPEAARGWRGRRVKLGPVPLDTAYKCISDAISFLHQAGVEFDKIGFVAAPEKAEEPEEPR